MFLCKKAFEYFEECWTYNHLLLLFLLSLNTIRHRGFEQVERYGCRVVPDIRDRFCQEVFLDGSSLTSLNDQFT